MRNRILIVEDDTNLRETLADILELEGYDVAVAANLHDARLRLAEQQRHLIVLDIMLPDGDGYQFATYLRKSYPELMILMLTARNLSQDMEAGFEAGADDYVQKPYHLKELLLRLSALMRRHPQLSSPPPSDIATINGFKVKWSLREVKNNQGQLIHFTKTEFDLLNYFWSQTGVLLTREQLLIAVWGRDKFIDNRTVDNFISKLKHRLLLDGSNSYQIRSVRGIGYCFECK